MVDDMKSISETRLFGSKSIQVTRPSRFSSKQITKLSLKNGGVLH
jgi:hypothetical protein